MIHFLELHSENIGFSFSLLFTLSFLFLILLDEARFKKLFKFNGVLSVFSIVCAVGFLVMNFIVSGDYNVIVSTIPVNVLKVVNVTTQGANVSYVLNGTLKNDDYSGSVKVDTTIAKTTAIIQVRRNIFGDQKTVINDLVLTNSDVFK